MNVGMMIDSVGTVKMSYVMLHDNEISDLLRKGTTKKVIAKETGKRVTMEVSVCVVCACDICRTCAWFAGLFC